MTEAEVVRIAREYREQLARNEDQALRRMARSWAQMEKELNSSYIALSEDIRALMDSGTAVPKELILTRIRYQQMMAQIEQFLNEYDKTAVQTITYYQKENFNLGLDSASAQLRYSVEEDDIWNKVGRDSAETIAGFAGNGAPLGELLRHDYGDIGNDIADTLITGMGLGKGSLAIADEITNILGEKEYSRAVRIARTEVNRAYRIANADQYRASGVVTKVLRLCYPPTACFACLMMDGEECDGFMVDDHPNGKCTSIAVTIGGHYPDWEHGQDWFLQQDEATQREIMGDARYEMWKKDGIALRDMVTMKDNPVWGGSPSILSINDIKQRYNVGNAPLISIPKPSPQAPTVQPISYKFADMMGDAYKGNKYTDDQRRELEAKYEAMPDWMQGFYKKYGGELQPVLENNAGVVPRKNIDFGYFSPYEQRVHFLAKRDAQGRTDENPFELGFHEYGHNMDFLAGGKDINNYLSHQYRDAQGRTFLQIINDGFEKTVKNFVGKTDTDKVTLQDVQSFSNMIKNNHSQKERGTLSDMFGNYSVSHGGSSYPFGIGHGKTYIKNRANAETESFAGITQAIIGNPDSLAVIKKYNPDAYEAYKDMVTKAGQQ